MADLSVNKQKMKGQIVSLMLPKTAVIEVTRHVKHPKYKKYFKRTKKYSAHYEGGGYKIGDKVIIESVRPLSKTKKWIIKKLNI